MVGNIRKVQREVRIGGKKPLQRNIEGHFQIVYGTSAKESGTGNEASRQSMILTKYMLFSKPYLCREKLLS